MAKTNKLPNYSDNDYRYPGDFRVEGIKLYNYAGNGLDISKVTTYINIYQDIDSGFVSGNLMFIDQTATTDKLPIIGNEFLEFKLRTPIDAGGDEEIDASQRRFQVYQKKSVRTTQNTQAVGLFFASVESVRNERVRVNRTLTGTYADMVNTFVKDKDYLNSKKVLLVDPTKGKYTLNFPNKRPVDAIKMTALLSEPRDFKTPHYLFFENNRAFHFRSLESLYRESSDSNRNRPFVAYFDLLSAFNPNFAPATDTVVSPFIKPLSFSFDNSYDTLGNTRLGMYGSNEYIHDMYDKTYIKKTHNYTKYYDKALHIDAPIGFSTYQGIMPPGPAELDDIHNIDDINAASESKLQIERINTSDISKSKAGTNRKYFDDYNARTYVTPYTRYNYDGDDKGNPKGLSFDVDVTQKSNMSRALRDYFTMTVDVPGNFTYNVGDLVWCEVPTYNAAFEDTKSKFTREGKIDHLLTGRYLVTKVHHQIDLLTQKHTTSVKVSRNTFAAKLPNADQFEARANSLLNVKDPIGSGIDLSNLQPLKLASELKIPTPQIKSVEDIAAKLGVNLNANDLSTRNAANQAVNAVLNSTTNRVVQNKYLASINSVVAERQNVLKTILNKAGTYGLPNINIPTSIEGLKNLGLSTISNTIKNNIFVQQATVAFKQVTSRVGSFFRGLF